VTKAVPRMATAGKAFAMSSEIHSRKNIRKLETHLLSEKRQVRKPATAKQMK
jgi:hypothetical protein